MACSYGQGDVSQELNRTTALGYPSLFPKGGRYLVPIKARVRAAGQLEEGDDVRVRLDVRVGRDHGRAERGT